MTTSQAPRTVTYGNWASVYGERVETYTEEEARRRFEAREQIDVIIGDPDVVTYIRAGRNPNADSSWPMRMGGRTNFLEQTG